MANTNKRFYGPAQLATSAATVYTCPASTIGTMKRARVSNPDSVAHTFTLSIGADAAGTRIYSQVTVQPQNGYDIWGPFTLTAGQIIQAFADNTALVLVINGTEQT
jgi:hypothetical protein